MFLLIVLQLVSLGVNSLPTEEFGTDAAFRKSRQLDLGLQEFSIKTDSQSSKNSESLRNENFQSLLKEYLPPVSPSSSDVVLSTQKTGGFDSASPKEEENLLCKLPYDFILCNRKKQSSKQGEINKLTDGVNKPSPNLAPPFSEINKNAFTTLILTGTTVKTETPSEKQSALTGFSQNAIISTKPKYSSFETSKQFTKSQTETDFVNTAEPSIESRSYLPPQPEFASAAQTAVEVVKPKNEEEHHHHHHHHHHHDENFNICTDAFHSFLCAPLKPRKIHTGAFPESLRGQGSFLKYQKLLPNREEVPAPSNTFQNEYLPPEKPKSFDFGVSFNSIKATEPPTKTTPKAIERTTVFTTIPPAPPKSFASPKIVLTPNVVVPVSPISSLPVIEPLKPSSPTPNSLLFYSPVEFTTFPPFKSSSTLNEFSSVFIPTITTKKPIISSSIQTSINPLPEKLGSSSSISKTFETLNTEKPILPQFVPFKPLPSDENRFYLPPLPSASFISTAKTISFAPETGNSPFVSTKISSPLPTQSTFSSSQRLFSEPQSTLRSSSNIIPYQEFSSTTTKAPISTFKAAPTTFKTTTTAAPALPQLPSNLDNSYLPPLPKFEPAANFITTTVKPFRPTPKKVVAAPNLVERPSNVDKSYVPPLPKFEPAANFITTTVKPFRPKEIVAAPTLIQRPANVDRPYVPPLPKFEPAADFITTTVKPFRPTPKKIVAAPNLVERPSNVDRSYLPPLPKFEPAANSITTTVKPFRPTPKKIVAAPNLVERPSNVDRSYLPPDPNVQPAAAQVNPVAVAPKVQNPFHHGRDLCTDPFHSFLCTPAKPRKRITGSVPSRFNADSSNTNEFKVRPAQSSQVPVSTLRPLPTEQRTFATRPATVKQLTAKPEILRPSETKVATGYNYPKPSSPFPLPSQQQIQISSTTSGYSYPKPLKPFPLPTELKEVVKSTPPPPPPPPPPVLQPSSTNQAKGYQYPKPEQSFELPQRQGYSYPKPQKQLVLPTEKEAKPFSSVDLLGNLGSAEFIPVNKLEKRNRLSESPKFGDRLTRQGRRHSA